MLDYVVCLGKSKLTETGSWLLFIFKREILEKSWELTSTSELCTYTCGAQVDPF